jgi:uncharacterized protein (DUF433 family)
MREKRRQRAHIGRDFASWNSSLRWLAAPVALLFAVGMTTETRNPLSFGAYTLPDAARLLQIPLPRLRSWVRGALLSEQNGQWRRFPVGPFETRGEGKDRHFGFLTLIELFAIAQLRNYGVKMATLRAGRQELEARFHTHHPFALQGLLTDGQRLLKEMGEDTLLELGSTGQTAFESVLLQFCHRLDFDTSTQLAMRFFPAGRDSCVSVDPRHSFGRPVIAGTNVTTEALGCLIRRGEKIDDIAADFRLDPAQVEDAWEFEKMAA